MDMRTLYQEIILDHAKDAESEGLREPFQAEVSHVNPTCGDEIRLRAHLQDDQVVDLSYQVLGCRISMASASMMCEQVVGRSIADALSRYDAMLAMMQSRGADEPDAELLGDAVALAGIAKMPARGKCALLGWGAMRDAVNQATPQEDP